MNESDSVPKNVEVSLTLEPMIFPTIVFIFLLVLFGFQYRAFGSREKTRKQDSVASFFHLREVLDRVQHNVFAIAASIPLSLIFVLVAWRGDIFNEHIVKNIASDISLEPVLRKIVPEMADRYIWFSTFVLTLIVFADRVSSIYRWIESATIKVAGVRRRINDSIAWRSKVLLKQRKYDDILLLLEKGQRGRLPLPEELEYCSDTTRLSFQLLHLAKHDIPRRGLEKAVSQVIDDKLSDAAQGERSTEPARIETAQSRADRERIDENRIQQDGLFEEEVVANEYAASGQEDLPGSRAEASKSRALRSLQLLADTFELRLGTNGPSRLWTWVKVWLGVLIFMLVSALYVYWTPRAGELVEPFGISWPTDAAIGSLAYTVAIAVLGTIVPMIVGIALYVWRSEQRGTVSISALTVFATIVFVLSLTNNSTFVIMQRIEIFFSMDVSTEFEYAWQTIDNIRILFGLPELVYILVHSIIPCIAVIVVGFIDPRDTLSVWDILVTIVGITTGHFVAYYLFELAAAVSWGFYWHQALMAAVLSTAALIILRMFWKPVDP